jgi:arabinose-5-phosphate isomerase
MDSAPPSGADLVRVLAHALLDAADRLDQETFASAVDLLSSVEGRVVLSGAGTSGMIARKIAATLTSTGTAALFLHPSDALHGGLGIVTSDDVAVLVSNSGETDELLVLLPYLEHRKVPVIAIVGNLNSTLSSRSAVALDAFAAREACPLNLAPTSSTAVALAVGDALAMSVMEVKHLTPEQFAFNHPSGRLGKRLTLRVSDVMRRGDDRPRVAISTPWLDLVASVSHGGLGAVTVEDADGNLLGIVTDGDVRRAVAATSPDGLHDLTAGHVMTAEPVSVLPGSLAYDALQLMENRPSQISVLPVVDELGHCLGVVRLHDLVRSGI